MDGRRAAGKGAAATVPHGTELPTLLAEDPRLAQVQGLIRMKKSTAEKSNPGDRQLGPGQKVRESGSELLLQGAFASTWVSDWQAQTHLRGL